MEITEHITALGLEAQALADAAKQAGLDADVPSCPGWDVRELLRHLGMIHLWAAGHLAETHEGSWGRELEDLTEFWPDLAVFWPDDERLIDWYLETNANLIRTLEGSPADVESWTFLPAPSPLAMWARRQAHETAVHRFDAENAAGMPTSFDPAFASDGIDEMLMGFALGKGNFPVETAKAMQVNARDTGDHWHVTLESDHVTGFRGSGPADVTLTGDAADLYLAVWNRDTDSQLQIDGDSDLLDKWHGNMRVRWS